MPAIIPGLDATLGALFIGLLIGTFLEGVLTTQAYIYYNQSRSDRFFLRFLVGFVWSMDAIHLIALCTMVYDYAISNWGNPPALADATWGFDISIFLTAYIAFTTQMFFCWRVWILTRSVPLIALVFSLSLISMGAGTACGVLTFVLVQYTKFVNYRWLVSLWLGTSAGCDIVIASVLSWTLWRSRTGFKSTDTIVTRLIVWTINTGLLTSLVAVVNIIFFDTIDNLVYFSFDMILGKLYANMFIATLNRRHANRQALVAEMESPSELRFDHSSWRMRKLGTGITTFEQEQTRASTTLNEFDREPEERIPKKRRSTVGSVPERVSVNAFLKLKEESGSDQTV